MDASAKFARGMNARLMKMSEDRSVVLMLVVLALATALVMSNVVSVLAA